jgi:uncharacterized protein (DUF1810 family)
MSDSNDTHDLRRFVEAQEGDVERISRELEEGNKRSHWMWYAFPQVEGLGSSPMARRYAIRSLEEAKAYLEHPVLGPRLRKWTELVLGAEERSAEQIFGYPDYLKFRSSMTLFSRVAESGSVFSRALEKYYDGKPDRKTLRILGIE